MSMQRKLIWLFMIILFCFIGLSVRLIVINRNKGQEYTKQVFSQQAYENETIPYKRGKITDCKGTVLADSQLVYNVIVDSKAVLSNDNYLEPTLDALEKLGADAERVREYMQKNPSSQYFIARKNLPYSEKKKYDTQLEEGIKEEDAQKLGDKYRYYSNIKGIWFESNYSRTYPSGDLISDVIGFANGANEGSFGLEEYYNDILNGTEGRIYGYLDDNLSLERTTVAARDGDNLVLTIDENIQSIVMKHLKRFGEQYQDNDHYGNGANNIGCIIMDVNNGEIKAMASYPSFDLSDPYDTDALLGMPLLTDSGELTGDYISKTTISLLSEEERLQALTSLWRNYCISSTYEPGSVSKPFTVAAGLETGAVSPDDTYYCEGYLDVAGNKIGCHNIYGDGTLTVGEAVERSCNVALMYMADDIGYEDFCEYQNIFNFGLRTNIDLADEARTENLIYKAEDMGEADLATNSFGQNFDVTMIQMITAFSSIVNGGIYYEPHIVSKITSPSGATVKTIEPRILKKTVSEETSTLLKEYMVQVVEGENGTGKTARPAGYRIGGKTGTAETLPRDNGEYVVSFMGYAPADDPQIAIYVVVDRPNVEKGEKQADAKFATGIVRNILTEVLPYMNIYMTEELTDEERAELQELGLKDTTGYTDADSE
jgi:stage V sporulation protein D (sporulation-specific penicillin-binding protein)